MQATEAVTLAPPLPLEVVHRPGQAAALLQPERARLLEALKEPASASSLGRRFALPRQRLNYHLRELEKLGLVEQVGERRKGNCIERMVRATAKSYVLSPDVLGRLGEGQAETEDRFSATYLVNAVVRILRDVARLMTRAAAERRRLATLTLETEIRFATAEDRARFAEELQSQIARLAAKYHDGKTDGGRRFRLLAASYPATEDKS